MKKVIHVNQTTLSRLRSFGGDGPTKPTPPPTIWHGGSWSAMAKNSFALFVVTLSRDARIFPLLEFSWRRRQPPAINQPSRNRRRQAVGLPDIL